MQIYLIAEQERRHVTVFQRDGENWQVTVHSAGPAIPLPFLGVTVSLEGGRWKSVAGRYDGVFGLPSGASA